LLLAAVALVVLIFDWFQGPERSHRSGVLALIGLAAVAAMLSRLLIQPLLTGEAPQGQVSLYSGRLVFDTTALFFMWFFTLATLATVAVSLRSRALAGKRVGEYYSLLVLATTSMAVIASSRDLILLYLAIETLSFSAYVLVGYPRRERPATEASLKYVLYGGVASGVMLFGMSYLYGLSGSTDIAKIYELGNLYGAPGAPAGVLAGKTIAFSIAMIMVLAGIGFKMAVVPFHSWCPDVYEGAPTPITAYLSVASKAAGFAAALRLLLPLFSAPPAEASVFIQRLNPWMLFWVISAATMTLGNLVAVWQTNVKRLLAYSSIAHAGYLAMGFTVTTREAFEAILVYFVVYLVTNLGAFFTVLFIEHTTQSADLAAYRGLVRRSPLLVVVMTIFLLSLLGIPPTAGFLAKFKMFGALVQAATVPSITLVIIAIVNSVISAFYYLKIVKVMTFDRPENEEPIALHPIDGAILVGFATAVVVLFVFWTPIQRLAEGIQLI
jgi:NADH-quinone oxidoreductase subunit N